MLTKVVTSSFYQNPSTPSTQGSAHIHQAAVSPFLVPFHPEGLRWPPVSAHSTFVSGYLTLSSVNLKALP